MEQLEQELLNSEKAYAQGATAQDWFDEPLKVKRVVMQLNQVVTYREFEKGIAKIEGKISYTYSTFRDV